MKKIKFNLGCVLTIVWLVGIFCFYIFGLFERPTSFNELGDFLAGVFAPVALIWIVAGYNQQSKALKISMDSLNTQNTLMKRNQNKLEPFIRVNANSIESFPLIDRIESQNEQVVSFNFMLKVEGNEARGIEISDIEGIKTIERINELKRDENFEFRISIDKFKKDEFFNDGKNLRYKIRYHSVLGDLKEDFYRFQIIEKNGNYKYMPASLSKRLYDTKRYY